MRKAGLISSLALCAATATLSAKEFPLTFKALDVDEALSLPGGSGTLGTLRSAKPSAIKNEPKAISERPLYGELVRSRGLVFRVDESTGDGKGYDELLIDLNQNGDLTDDPVFRPTGKPIITKTPSQTRELSRFGPIEAPAAKAVGGVRPVYFAELNHYRRPATPGASSPLSAYAGYLRLRAGSIFETLVELDGIRQKVGVVDGNANLRFGDEPTSTTFNSAGQENWYFGAADAFLCDTDGSGKFEDRPGDPESSPFGPMLYFGATPYRVTLTADCTSLRVEPWDEKLANLDVQPNGAQVRNVLVAWEQKPDDWRLIKAGVAKGRVQVPPGKVRLTGCVLESKTPEGQPLVLAGYYRKMDNTLDARTSQATTLRCGAPLEVKLSAEKRTVTAADSMYNDNGPGKSAVPALRIQAEILGVAGETYATFAKGSGLSDEPPKPQFTILTKDGKQVGSGNLEFG